MLTAIDMLSRRADRNLRVAVHHRMSLLYDLPIAYRARLERIPGVRFVNPFSWYGGVYRSTRDLFSSIAVDPSTFQELWPENVCTPEEFREFSKDRMGCLIGDRLAVKFGWSKGDRITLKGTIRPVNLEFHVCAVLSRSIDPMALWLQRDYLEEALGNPGLVSNFWLMVDRQGSIPRVIRAAEELFVNSPYPVRAETEKSFWNMLLAMIGNIRGLVGGIGTIVVISIMLVAGNTVAMSVRERTGEIAVMKAIGFRPGQILALVLAESCLIALAGGVLGAGSAHVFYGSPRLVDVLGPYSSFFVPSVEVLVEGVLTALGIGLVSGFFPALSAARLSVADALRRVG